MTEPDDELSAQEQALIRRVDDLIELHRGDLRAVIEARLMAYDHSIDRADDFVRGRRIG